MQKGLEEVVGLTKCFDVRAFLGRQLATGEAVRPAFVVICEIAFIGMRLKEILPRIDKEAAGAHSPETPANAVRRNI
jgi:hypothetical protein